MHRKIAVLASVGLLGLAHPALAGKKEDKALREAVKAGSVERARAALASGADPNTRSGIVWGSVLNFTLVKERPRLAQLLVEAGAEVDVDSLLKIATLEDSATLEYLLSNGTSPHAVNVYGATLLESAARAGRLETVLLLLEAGADPNVQNVFGTTPLMLAAGGHHLETVLALVEAGADRSAISTHNHSAANSATRVVWKASSETFADSLLAAIELVHLLEDTESGRLGTSLFEAAARGSVEDVRAALDAGASPNFRNAVGSTALMAAVVKDHRQVARVLIDAGANLTIRQLVPRGVLFSTSKTMWRYYPEEWTVGFNAIELLTERPPRVLLSGPGAGEAVTPDYDVIDEGWIEELRSVYDRQLASCYVQDHLGEISLAWGIEDANCRLPFDKDAVAALAEEALRDQFPTTEILRSDDAVNWGRKKQPGSISVMSGPYSYTHSFEIEGRSGSCSLRWKTRAGGLEIMPGLFLEILRQLTAARPEEASGG